MYRADILEAGERIARFANAEDAVIAAQAIANATGKNLMVSTRDNDTLVTPEA